MTYEDVKNNEEIKSYIKNADCYLEQIGYTEHSFAHLTKCAETVDYIMSTLEYDRKLIELGKIAAYMHDIGNVVNRDSHAQSGALIAYHILDKLGMEPNDIAKIITAIGNHDEKTSIPVSVITSALIIADKIDVRRSRVRNALNSSDIHDRVNYAVTDSSVKIDKELKTITLNLTIDTNICPIIEYFEIFLSRMMLCKKASKFLGLDFKLIINKQNVL